MNNSRARDSFIGPSVRLFALMVSRTHKLLLRVDPTTLCKHPVGDTHQIIAGVREKWSYISNNVLLILNSKIQQQQIAQCINVRHVERTVLNIGAQRARTQLSFLPWPLSREV